MRYVCLGERKRRNRVLMGKPKGRKPLGRLRSLGEDIEIHLQECFFFGGGGVVDWIDLFLVRDMWRAVINAVKTPLGFHKIRGIS
jgi:hypothetical protein